MSSLCKFFSILMLFQFLPLWAQKQPKLDTRFIIEGETLNYKATWGFLTIGSGYTRIDPKLYKIGNAVCYKIEISGQTNGLAKLFYVQDKWVSFIDTSNITTHRTFRSIREGRHALDEIVHFDQQSKKAEVKVYDKKIENYVLKNTYEISEEVRDVVAGFLVFRFIDLSRYTKGEVFTINGFYEDEAYKIDVIYEGFETVERGKEKVLCYRLKPIVPKNKVFNGHDAVVVWLSANKSKAIVRIHARLFVGNLVVELQK